MTQPYDPWQQRSASPWQADPTAAVPEAPRSGHYAAPGYGPRPGQPGYGEPVPGPGGYLPDPNGQGDHGRPAYGQTQQDGQTQQYAPQQQYGQTRQYGQGYPSQPAHGHSPPGFGQPAWGAQRPSGATVITAGVVQIVQASLFVLVGILMIFVADFVNSAGDSIDTSVDSGVGAATDTVARWVAVLGVVIAGCAVFMIVLAALAMRGRRWAAITSVVLQSISVLLVLVGLANDNSSPAFSVVFLLASVAVIALYLSPPASRFFAAAGGT